LPVIWQYTQTWWPAALSRQGLHEARREYLLLMNNDFVTTDGWLNQLIALADIDIGAVAQPNPPPCPTPQVGKRLNARTRLVHHHTAGTLTLIVELTEPSPYPPPCIEDMHQP
jgi:hypothetical protein